MALPEGRMTSGTSDRIAREQAALRRVATLVARAAPAEEQAEPTQWDARAEQTRLDGTGESGLAAMPATRPRLAW